MQVLGAGTMVGTVDESLGVTDHVVQPFEQLALLYLVSCLVKVITTSIVYRVEVTKDYITIWTILDSWPDGTINYEQNGVTINFGSPFGVP